MRLKPDNPPRSKLLGYNIQQSPKADGKLADRFKILIERCNNESGSLHVAQLTPNPAFLEIVSMGDDVIPLLLAGLVGNEPKNWFGVLQKITGVNPVHPASHGSPKSMAQDWLRWGQERGIIPLALPDVVSEDVSSGSVSVGFEKDKIILQATGDGNRAQLTPEEAELTAARLVNAARQARQSQAS